MRVRLANRQVNGEKDATDDVFLTPLVPFMNRLNIMRTETPYLCLDGKEGTRTTTPRRPALTIFYVSLRINRYEPSILRPCLSALVENTRPQEFIFEPMHRGLCALAE